MNRPDEIRRIIVLKRQAAKLILESANEKIERIYNDIDELRMELKGYAAPAGPDEDTASECRV
jgi:hypothetical protein